MISSTFLHIFGDMTSSIECGCAVFMSRSDKEDICYRRIKFWFWMSYRTCFITVDE